MTRILIKIEGDRVNYRIKGFLTLFPLWTNKAQWLAWGETV